MDVDFDIEDGIKWVAGTMYGGGVETVCSSWKLLQCSTQFHFRI